MKGWAADWDQPSAYVNVIPAVIQNGSLTWGRIGQAWWSRPDVEAAFPETRMINPTVDVPGHGYRLEFPTIPDSTATVCVVALNIPGTPGDNTILGCQTVAT